MDRERCNDSGISKVEVSDSGVVHRWIKAGDPSPITPITEPVVLLLVENPELGVLNHREFVIKPPEREPQS